MDKLVTQEEGGISLKPVLGILAVVMMIAVVSQLTRPAPCTPGETKCVGYDLYQCSDNCQWVLIKQNATECGFVPAGLFKCPYCGEGFDTLSELVAHVTEQHPDKPPLKEVDITWD